MQQLSTEELRKIIAEKVDLFLLDVREEYEHHEFNIGGTLIPLGEIMSKALEIPANVPVVVYCQKGIRSQIAIQRLEDKYGFTNLLNLEGGMQKWKANEGYEF